MSTTTTTTALSALVDDLDRAVRRPGSDQEIVDAVSEALRPALSSPDLLDPSQRVGDPTAYKQHLLHVAPDGAFSLVALVWLPGQATPIHDHLAWCVVGIHEGAEYETGYRLTRRGTLVPTGEAVALPGDVAGLLPPGDIHRVHNVGDSLAISLHVYGADLRATGSSIRRRYDQPVARW
jgi:predicted metal-dependent enzyme (double-stranded beta helix superfamily)